MSDILYRVKSFCKKNDATILTCIGGIGVITTTVMAVKATPKALEKLEIAETEKGEELTKFEKFKITIPIYIPTVVSGTATIACIFGANVLNKHHQASLASAYALIDNSYKEYKNKLKELYGEDTHQEIMDAIAAEKAENVGVRAPGYCSNNYLFVDEKCGEDRLFYDEFGERFFTTTIEQVISAEYHLNRNYTLRGFTVLNEFYDFLGLEPTAYGEELGWANVDDGMEWIEFNHRPTTIKGQDCIVIEMPFAPDLDWKDYYL